jgi:hypothetical protein
VTAIALDASIVPSIARAPQVVSAETLQRVIEQLEQQAKAVRGSWFLLEPEHQRALIEMVDALKAHAAANRMGVRESIGVAIRFAQLLLTRQLPSGFLVLKTAAALADLTNAISEQAQSQAAVERRMLDEYVASDVAVEAVSGQNAAAPASDELTTYTATELRARARELRAADPSFS